MNSTEDTKNFAELFIKELLTKDVKDHATVVGLYGDLGAGKTTFTKSVAHFLGLTEHIVSPTFVIMKRYLLPVHSAWKYFVHIDAYRLEKASEVERLGWQELISNKENLIFIEWPEKISEVMPEHTKLQFTFIDENTREITRVNN